MAKSRKKNITPKPRKLDPVKGTIYVAVISLVSAITVAAFTNSDRIWPHPQPTSQAEEIVAFQDHQRSEIMEALEEREQQALQANVTSPAQESAAQVDTYLKSNADTRVMLEKRHGEFKESVKRGDMFKANVIKTEVNEQLAKDTKAYTKILFHFKLDSFGSREGIRFCYLMAPKALRVTSLDVLPVSLSQESVESRRAELLAILSAISPREGAQPVAAPAFVGVGGARPRIGPEM
jgi:hypothetical protein